MNSKMDPMGRAIDISPLSVETMKERGIKKVMEQDFFTQEEQYDTILIDRCILMRKIVNCCSYKMVVSKKDVNLHCSIRKQWSHFITCL